MPGGALGSFGSRVCTGIQLLGSAREAPPRGWRAGSRGLRYHEPMRSTSPGVRLGVTLACLALAVVLVWTAVRGWEERARTTVDTVTVPETVKLDAGIWLEVPEGSRLKRPRLEGELLARLMPQVEANMNQAHPRQYFGYKPNIRRWRDLPEHPEGGYWITTNSLGLRRDSECAEEQPDLRVLVAGDSHVDGVCSSDESFPTLLEVALGASAGGKAVEVLNAARGGQGPYNYLGTVERFADLAPDAVVVWFTGSNDWLELVRYGRLFESLPGVPYGRDVARKRKRCQERDLHVFMAGLHTAHALLCRSEDFPLAQDLGRRWVHDLQLIANEVGAPLVLVYLPPPILIEGVDVGPTYAEMLRILEVEDAEVRTVLQTLGDTLASACMELEVPFFDLGPPLAAGGNRNFWKGDLHLSLEGHAVVRDVLLEALAQLLP